jgi:hypothetical protein
VAPARTPRVGVSRPLEIANQAGLIENVEELAAESGVSSEEMKTRLEEMQATIDAVTRRILVVAQAR